MKNIFSIVCASSAFFFFLSSTAALADYEDGVEAAFSGDFDTKYLRSPSPNKILLPVLKSFSEVSYFTPLLSFFILLRQSHAEFGRRFAKLEI